jgi:hypothetical protein
LRRERNTPMECDAAAGEDARGPVRGRPRPQRAGAGGSVGEFRQTSSVMAAAGEDARGPVRGRPRPQRAGVGGSVGKFRQTRISALRR